MLTVKTKMLISHKYHVNTVPNLLYYISRCNDYSIWKQQIIIYEALFILKKDKEIVWLYRNIKGCSQAPFISLCLYLGETDEYKQELAMLIEEIFKQRILGMKNKVGVYVTVAFPKLLYILEEDNIHKNSKYWYLTQLAAKCTAKRMVPDYISEKKMREIKEGDCLPCMGK